MFSSPSLVVLPIDVPSLASAKEINCDNKNTTKFVEYYDASDCEST